MRSLLAAPQVDSFEWHRVLDSTNRRAAALAAAGAQEIAVVGADAQTAGRGRAGRSWNAPPGSALLLSLVLRPAVEPRSLPLLALLTGLALAEAAEVVAPGAEVTLKWPNDLLARPAGARAWRKAAGILVEASAGTAVVGIGCNVDWGEAEVPQELAGTAISLAEAAEGPVGRWHLLEVLLGAFGDRYVTWCAQPTAFLDAYRARCSTIGSTITANRPAAQPLAGLAEAVRDSGALRVRTADGRAVEVSAGDVTHVRPGPSD